MLGTPAVSIDLIGRAFRLHAHHAAIAARTSSATPTAARLRDSKLSMAPRAAKTVEQRTRLLQRYRNELCAPVDLAQNELVTAFFWPNDGSGSVVAPDGSAATMTGDE